MPLSGAAAIASQTQTGVINGNITTKGFDVRIGSNTDSFSDVFSQDASGNYLRSRNRRPTGRAIVTRRSD